jgi:alpha-amylase
LLAFVFVGCQAREDESPAARAQRERLERARAAALVKSPEIADWRRRVIYFALLDRFANGDKKNDRLHGEPDCNDPHNIHRYQGGDLVGLTKRVDYIKGLGAGAIWLTPLYKGVAVRRGANCGFPGYWADFVDPYTLELDPRFGTTTDFETFLATAHRAQLKVMLDMVVNHAGYGAKLQTQHPDWFTDPASCAQQGSPDIFCELAGLPDFDHRRADVRDYLVDVHEAWTRRFAIDGIRMDTVKHVQPSYFRDHWIPAMRRIRPALYVIGELLDEHSFDRFDRYLDAGFDGLFNFPLRRALIDTFAKGASTDVVASRVQQTLQRFGAQRTSYLVNLLDNHDVPRFIEDIPWGIDADDARRRYLLALTALMTMPGVPQLYYGNEVGMSGGQDPHNRRFMPDWAFDKTGRSVDERPGYLSKPSVIFAHVKKLIALRNASPALQTGSYSELWRQNGAHNSNVWAYLRSNGKDHVIVVYNNGSRWTDVAVPLDLGGRFGEGTRFIDALGQVDFKPVLVSGGKLRVGLPGRSAVILVPRPWQASPKKIAVSFQVEASTYWGQNVYVTGNLAELGHWDLSRARKLVPQSCSGQTCSWTTSIDLPLGQAELKYVKIDESLDVVWEQGANRVLQVSAGVTPLNPYFR